MAKIVILWGQHPLEVNAGVHAHNVASILRRKYGHDVEVRKIPLEETNYHIIRSVAKGKMTPEEAVEKLRKLKTDIDWIKEHLPRKQGHFVFNFHGTSTENFGEGADFKKKPSDFYIHGGRSRGEIRVLNRTPGGWSENGRVIEVPETDRLISEKIAAENNRAVEQIRRVNSDYKPFLLDMYYKGSEIKLPPDKERSQRFRFQSAVISEKIAHYLDTEVIANERNPGNPRWKPHRPDPRKKPKIRP